jgi:hypothetical protein
VLDGGADLDIVVFDVAGGIKVDLALSSVTADGTDTLVGIEGVQAGAIVTLEILRRTPDGWDTAIVRIRAR